MIETTRAITLNYLRYSETSIIAQVYTEKFGRVSFMVKGALRPRSRFKAVLFEPFTLIEVEYNNKHSQSLKTPINIQLIGIQNNIRTDVRKSTLALFLSELVYKTVREEHADYALFEFLFQSIQLLDAIEKGTFAFHLWFIVQLSRLLGFGPMNNYSEALPVFDVKSAKFVSRSPYTQKYIDGQEAQKLSQLMDSGVSGFQNIELSVAQRNKILDSLLDLYSVHHEGISSLKSLSILREVFNA
jgi:DNA repair protein RecO (recombination protein O)